MDRTFLVPEGYAFLFVPFTIEAFPGLNFFSRVSPRTLVLLTLRFSFGEDILGGLVYSPELALRSNSLVYLVRE